MLVRDVDRLARLQSRPSGPIPLVEPAAEAGRAADLAVTWYGHSSALIEVDGYRVLADPVWSDRCSPSRDRRPRAAARGARAAGGAAAIDAVVISHDHYDHLDIDTILRSGAHPAGPVRRAARRRRAPAHVGHPRGPHRRTRLERERTRSAS